MVVELPETVEVDGDPRLNGGEKAPSRPVLSRSGSTQNLSANIRVVVRVRPPNPRELKQNSRIVIDVVDDRMLVFDPNEEQLKRNFLKRPNKDLKFVFDNVCDINSSNQDVFETTTKDIVAALMDGYNCSVFAYGATGAGKTFTMIGNQENPGITYLTMEHLFYSINSFEKDREFDIGVSYIEVYNENVFDLLKPSKTQLREDKYGGITPYNIKTSAELFTMLENGNKNRSQHATDANAESSRSHAVFQVYITMRYRTSSQVRMVKLSMIDLAGSERASATSCIGARFKEGANINKSLLTLGNCINKLADGSNHIPYRDSKLTLLLKDSLGGNCKTVMIANVSPSSLSFEDTYNTLKYAARANKIQLSIKKNVFDVDVRALQNVKNKVKELEEKLALSTAPAPAVRERDLVKDTTIKEWRRRILEEEKSYSVLESHLLSLMTCQRVLALRHRLRTRAFSHIVDLAHRSSAEGMEQMCTEDIPRQERATENYMKQSVNLDFRILIAWKKWSESHKTVTTLCTQALSDRPELEDFVKLIKMQSENRKLKALDQLKHKLVMIENDEFNAYAENMSDMPGMLKKLYLTLKGYDKAPPALTDEYLEIMKKATSVKASTWSDDQIETCDTHFKFITTLDLEQPSSIPDFALPHRQPKEDLHEQASEEMINTTVDINGIDSDDVTNIENKENFTYVRKRKGTPIKLAHNERIIMDDSFEALDANRTMSSSKMVKRDCGDIAPEVENCFGVIDPKDLNSTFVMAGKMEVMKRYPFKTEPVPIKRVLTDRTNTFQNTFSFNDNKAKVVKPPPAVERALPFRRPATAPVVSEGPGFGSSLSRDGKPLQTNIQGCPSAFRNGLTAIRRLQAKVVKPPPAVERALPFRRPATAPVVSEGPGFGSSLSRDGKPLQTNIQGCPSAFRNGLTAIRRLQAKVVKPPPAVERALPFRRPATAPVVSEGPGFGSSLSRDGKPLQTNIEGCPSAFWNGLTAIRRLQAKVVKPPPAVERALPFRRPATAPVVSEGPGFGSSLSRDGKPLQTNIQAKVVKPPPAVERALPFRRPATAPVVSEGPGFGSSLSRDGKPLQTNIQVRSRERVQTHPCSRPNAFNRR